MGAVPIVPDLPGVDADGVFGVQTLDDGEAVLNALDARAEAEACRRRGRRLHRRRDGRGDVSAWARRHGRRADRTSRCRPSTRTWAGSCTTPWRGSASTCEPARRSRGSRPTTTAASARSRFAADARSRPTSSSSASASGPTPTSRRRPVSRSAIEARSVPTCRCAVRAWRGVGRRRLRARSLIASPGPHLHVPLGTHANKQGKVIGTNIGGGYATFPGIVRTAVSKVCHLEIARTGLLEADAKKAGLRVRSRHRQVDDEGGLLPWHEADDREDAGRASQRAAARRPDRRQRGQRASASTPSRSPCGTG